ncbi:uncharacterized protein LOC118464141 isoform X2 [Anopheles albimanus]|nr:uncharacterized protein LOC118464141 isoform X2 [Anopheles albimanus]
MEIVGMETLSREAACSEKNLEIQTKTTEAAFTAQEMCVQIVKANAKSIALLHRGMRSMIVQLTNINDILQNTSSPRPYQANQTSDITAPPADFPITSEASMIAIDNKLSDHRYRFELEKIFMAGIGRFQGAQQRFHLAWMKMFETAFVANCSWTGKSKAGTKVAFCKYRYVILFLRQLSGSDVDEKHVKQLIISKLHNAIHRLANFKGIRKSVPRVYRKVN